MDEEGNTIEKEWKRMEDKIKEVVRKLVEKRENDRGKKGKGRG